MTLRVMHKLSPKILVAINILHHQPFLWTLVVTTQTARLTWAQTSKLNAAQYNKTQIQYILFLLNDY